MKAEIKELKASVSELKPAAPTQISASSLGSVKDSALTEATGPNAYSSASWSGSKKSVAIKVKDNGSLSIGRVKVNVSLPMLLKARGHVPSRE